MPLFREFLLRTLAQIIATKEALLIAHRSKGADVAKLNGKLRLLSVLSSFWTRVYSLWFKAWDDSQQPLHWEHVFFRNKRKEAILVSTPTACQETVHRHAAPEEHPYHDLFLQRQRNACVDIQAANGHVQGRPTVGNLMGHRFVPCAFALTYQRSITENCRALKIR